MGRAAKFIASRLVRVDKENKFIVSQDFDLNRLKFVGRPEELDDAISLRFFEERVGTLPALSRDSVKAGTQGNNIIDLLNQAPGVLDGYALQQGDRVLVKDQTNAVENGIYLVEDVGTGVNGKWVRANDLLQPGTNVYIENGTVNSTHSYQITTAGPIVAGVTSLTFKITTIPGQTAGATTYTLSEKDAIEMQMRFVASKLENYKELTYTGDLLTNISVYNSPLKITKIFNQDLIYDGNNLLIRTELTRISDNILLSKTFAYDSNQVLVGMEQLRTP